MAPAPPHEHDDLVRTCAAAVHRELRLTSVEMDDLVQYGYLGLLQCEKGFDPQQGVPLRAYVYKRVRWAILNGVRDMSNVPRKVHAASKRLLALDDVVQETQRPKPDADARQRTVSLDETLGHFRESYVLSTAVESTRPDATEEALNLGLDTEPLWSAVAALPERHQTVVRLLYQEDKVLKDLGGELGVSEGQASRIHTKTLELLQDKLT
jgi:RNA polymerase sigma factor for flagellar operon FliA